MFQRLLITFCILLYAVGVPILEINDSHVFNPNWTPHAKIHEVWQLATNSALGVLSLWLIWKKSSVMLGALISLTVTAGFMFAFAIKDLYEGSMKYLDGSEKTIFDVNIGVAGFGLAIILLLLSIALEYRSQKAAGS